MALDAKQLQELVDSGRFCAHAEVTELLEVYLEHAKKAPWGAIAICLVGHPNVCSIAYAGEISLEESLVEGMGKLNDALKTSIDAWTLPPQDESLDASYAVYNVANGPLGYDFLIWLLNAEMKRQQAGAPGPLKVAFWLGKDWQQRINRDKRRMWLENVFRPALKLIGAVEDRAAMRGHRDAKYVCGPLVEAWRAGWTIPKLKAPGTPPQAIYPYITITLREAEHWPERNSRVEEWVRFAYYLKAQGKKIIFVRDTAKADEPIAGFDIVPQASRDLLYRMATYEAAEANLFTSNGPVTLPIFAENQKPWLQFIPNIDELSPYTANRPSFWTIFQGISPGEQYPWSGPGQRIVWGDDTFENIVEAWHNHISPAAAAA